MQGGQGNVVADGLDHRAVNEGGLGELLASVHHTVTNGEELNVLRGACVVACICLFVSIFARMLASSFFILTEFLTPNLNRIRFYQETHTGREAERNLWSIHGLGPHRATPFAHEARGHSPCHEHRKTVSTRCFDSCGVRSY